MRLPVLISAALMTTAAAIKTSIYINQVSGYSALPSCAEDRVSAIVRDQSSGCGDGGRLTSFSCFCVEQSSHMSRIISTAVQNLCSAQATTVLASLTAPLPEVTSALAIFDSYCARSTELAWYQVNSTSIASSLITPAPSSSFASSTSTTSPLPVVDASPSHESVPVVAIAAPVVIGVVTIAGVIGLLFWLRRKKAAKARSKTENPCAPTTYTAPCELEHGDVHEMQGTAQGMMGDVVKYRHELESRPAELDGGRPTDSRL